MRMLQLILGEKFTTDTCEFILTDIGAKHLTLVMQALTQKVPQKIIKLEYTKEIDVHGDGKSVLRAIKPVGEKNKWLHAQLLFRSNEVVTTDWDIQKSLTREQQRQRDIPVTKMNKRTDDKKFQLDALIADTDTVKSLTKHRIAQRLPVMQDDKPLWICLRKNGIVVGAYFLALPKTTENEQVFMLINQHPSAKEITISLNEISWWAYQDELGEDALTSFKTTGAT